MSELPIPYTDFDELLDIGFKKRQYVPYSPFQNDVVTEWRKGNKLETDLVVRKCRAFTSFELGLHKSVKSFEEFKTHL